MFFQLLSGQLIGYSVVGYSVVGDIKHQIRPELTPILLYGLVRAGFPTYHDPIVPFLLRNYAIITQGSYIEYCTK